MPKASLPPPDPIDEARMSIGDHLEELRWRLMRGVIALVIACIACIWPSKYLLEIIARPVILVLRSHGQPDSFLATSPVENLVVYIKVVLIFGIIIAGPYVLHQVWAFVAAGLYPGEKRWVTRLVPISVGLFLVGVAFMYTFVLIASLNFLVGFSSWLPMPTAAPSALERALLHAPDAPAAQTQPVDWPSTTVPLLAVDPNDAPIGGVWVNVREQKLKVRYPNEQTYSVQLLRDDRRALVTTHFKIGEYLSFVLVLTIAFGLAFQTPLVVTFLAWSGIVPVETFRKYRKIVILVIVFIAGILAPPDLLSHILLSVPMWLLFELGVWIAGRKKPGAAADEPQS